MTISAHSENRQVLRAVGLMSGTSMDGVDVALIETDGQDHLICGAISSLDYSADDRALLRQALKEARPLLDRASRPGVLARAEAMITRRHGEAVQSFLRQNGLKPESIDVIGFHGQTVLHRPEKKLTIQIGDGPALARLIGCPVVYDLRAADVAAGGQGAPLVPVFHQALVRAAGLSLPVAVLNIGGVANLTLVREGADPLACDTGPGNALLDDLMLEKTGTPMDRNGETAAKGRVNEGVLAKLLDHEFFRQPPPKSLDRNAFSRALVEGLSLSDAAATLTAFTAASIGTLFPHLQAKPALLVVCGGGARNPVLMQFLEQRLPCRVVAAESLSWDSGAMEAQAFAYLAVRSVKNLPLSFATTTGVPSPMCGGVLAQP